VGILIRQTNFPVVKSYGDEKMEHYSKSRREFTALTIFCWSESLGINLKAKEGHLSYLRGLPGSCIGSWCGTNFHGNRA